MVLCMATPPWVMYLVVCPGKITLPVWQRTVALLRRTEELVLPSLKGGNGQSLRVGTDFFLAFSPERINPGQTEWTIRNTPKVLGGETVQCGDLSQVLYEFVVPQVVRVSSPRVAEMVKLLENTFRATNIALANEVAIMCDQLGRIVDWEGRDRDKVILDL